MDHAVDVIKFMNTHAIAGKKKLEKSSHWGSLLARSVVDARRVGGGGSSKAKILP